MPDGAATEFITLQNISFAKRPFCKITLSLTHKRNRQSKCNERSIQTKLIFKQIVNFVKVVFVKETFLKLTFTN